MEQKGQIDDPEAEEGEDMNPGEAVVVYLVKCFLIVIHVASCKWFNKVLG